MQKILLLVLACGFIGVGLFGFTCGSLPGTFGIDPLYNVAYILSGLLAFASVMPGERAVRFYARFFGLVYLIVSIVGFFEPTSFICGLSVLNVSDYWPHIGIAVLLFWIGFSKFPEKGIVIDRNGLLGGQGSTRVKI